MNCKMRMLLGTLMLLMPQSRAMSQLQSPVSFPKLYLAVQAIRAKCKIPTGLEMATADPDDSSILLDDSCKDFARTFSQIVARRPIYEWSLEDGVYDLYPRAKTEQFSGLKIKRFVLNDASRIEALVALDKLPEVQKWLSAHGELSGVLISHAGPAQTEKRISFEFNNASLRKILNWLSINLGNNPNEPQWAIEHYGDKIRRYNLSF